MVYAQKKAAFFTQTKIIQDGFDWVYLFCIGGLAGTIYEVLLNLVLHGILEDRSGSILTPFNYVYGTGALLLFLSLSRLKKPSSVFLAGGLLGGALEFGLSVFQEVVFGSRSWDYSARFLNIGGRTALPYMLVWGLLCLLAVYVLFPALLRWIHRIPDHTRRQLSVFLLMILLVDGRLTSFAVLRYAQRTEAVPSENPLAQITDTVFDDDFMRIHFPNMRVSKAD